MTINFSQYFDFSDFRKALDVLRGFFLPNGYTSLELRLRDQREIEETGNELSRRIVHAKDLTELYAVVDEVRLFYSMWPKNMQAKAWFHSLTLQAQNKGRKICNLL